MVKVCDYINSYDSNLAQFLSEQFDKDNIPSEFDDVGYIPNKDELKNFTVEQLNYLLMSATVDVNDFEVSSGLYEFAINRRNFINDLVRKELKSRNES